MIVSITLIATDGEVLQKRAIFIVIITTLITASRRRVVHDVGTAKSIFESGLWEAYAIDWLLGCDCQLIMALVVHFKGRAAAAVGSRKSGSGMDRIGQKSIHSVASATAGDASRASY